MHEYKFDIPDICYENMDLFLQVLKIQYDSFASYSKNIFYFNTEINQTNVQNFINSLKLETIQKILFNNSKDSGNIIIRNENPTPLNNFNFPVIWLNSKTGEIFTCTQRRENDNVWRGTFGTLIRNVPNANKFDFFGDGSRIALYLLDRNTKDLGGKYHGKGKDIAWLKGKDNYCAYSKSRYSQIYIKGLPFSSETLVVTICGWIKWNKKYSAMPFGWRTYNIYCNGHGMGFNTFNGDCYGVKYIYSDFIYCIFEFRKSEYGTININGKEMELSKQTSRNINISNAKMDSSFRIFGCGNSSGYRQFGHIDRVSIFNRSLTLSEKQELYTAESSI